VDHCSDSDVREVVVGRIEATKPETILQPDDAAEDIGNLVPSEQEKSGSVAVVVTGCGCEICYYKKKN